MEALKLKYETPRNRRTMLISPEYQRITRQLKKMERNYEENPSPEQLKDIRSLRLKRAKVPSRIGVGIRINYVRYADD